jgi:hypothetical protein
MARQSSSDCFGSNSTWSSRNQGEVTVDQGTHLGQARRSIHFRWCLFVSPAADHDFVRFARSEAECEFSVEE